MVAKELKYHCACLTGPSSRGRVHKTAIEKQKQSQKKPDLDAYPLALSELLTYIVETNPSPEGSAVFRLADLMILYKQWLQQLGVKTPDVNPIRLKDNLLTAITGLKARKQTRDVLLAF